MDGVAQQSLMRDDLVVAHAEVWERVTNSGTYWNGAQRRAIAIVVLSSLGDDIKLPPWTSNVRSEKIFLDAEVLNDDTIDAIYRISVNASTLTEDWYRRIIARGLNPLAFVELVGVVVAVSGVHGFYQSIGIQLPPIPDSKMGELYVGGPSVEAANLNWVLVAVPADSNAAVVQALSAVPAAWDLVSQILASHYIPVKEMGNLNWNRGRLTRVQMETIASRLSEARECFY